MAFLFKSKKEREKAGAQTKDVNGTGGTQTTSQQNGRVNEKQTTPGSSVNNSLASLQEKNAQSPEQPTAQRMPQQGLSDLPVSPSACALRDC